MNEAINIIDGLKAVFETATTGFDAFYKEAQAKDTGNSSKAASSGNYSKAASSGNYSKAASSGNSSKAASSGDSSTAASSGDYSTAASSGDSSTAASSGDYSTAASSGDYSTAASSGNYSKAASSGNSSKAASSGYSSKAASSGDSSTAASSGNYSKAASSGDSSTAASSGNYSKAASSGNSSTAASSGNYSKAASSGNSSKAASSGNYSKAASKGENAGCAAIGYRAAVSGDLGNLLMASEYFKKDGKNVPVGGKADLVDGKKLKAGCWYIVEGGEWVEVDFTDGIFSRVISNKGGVKKVKDDNGNVLFIVTDGENSSHGKTLKEARDGLIYKISSRDTTAYEGWTVNDTRPVEDIIKAYRAITGACETGTKSFVQSKGKIPGEMKIADVIAATSGVFGNAEFAEFFKVKS